MGWSFFNQIWQHLTEPMVTVPEQSLRRQAESLAGVIVLFGSVGLLLSLLAIFFDFDRLFLPQRAVFVAIFGLLSWAPAYYYCRRGYVRRAFWIIILSAIIISFVSINPNKPLSLIYLVLPVLLSAIYFNWKQLVVFTGIIILLGSLYTVFLIDGSKINDIVDASTYAVMTFALVIVVSMHQTLLANDRLAELKRDNQILLQVRQALEDEQRRYRGLFEQTNDTVFLIGLDGKHLEINKQGSNLLGYAEDEIVKRPLFDFIHPDEHDLGNQNLTRLLAGESLPVFERTLVHRDGSYRIGEVNATLVRDVNGQPSHIQSIVRDITERKQTEIKLQQQEALVRAVLESTTDGILAVDNSRKIILTNSQMTKLWHIPPEIMHHENDLKIMAYIAQQLEQPDEFLKGIESLYESENAEFETFYTQDGRVTRCHSLPLWLGSHRNGRVWRFRDVTEREAAISALRASEERLELALNGANLGLWDVHFPTGFTVYDVRWANMLGYEVDELTPHESTWQELMHPDDLDFVLAALAAHLNGNVPDYQVRHRLRTKSGEWKWVLSAGRVVECDEAGSPIRAVGIHQDVTEQHDTQMQLQKSLAEKDLLIMEIHHRVKNNLQVVSSLLDWQASLIEDASVKQSFLESQSRIQTMALVHEALYQSSDLRNVDIRAYIMSLVDYLRDLLPLHENVVFNVEVNDVELGLNTAVPCGQLINELLNNAVKHAYPDRNNGEITVCFYHQAGTYQLIVADNGVGFPPDVNFDEADTLGLLLIKTLIQQLSGDLQFITGSQGTSYTIQFKAVEY